MRFYKNLILAIFVVLLIGFANCEQNPEPERLTIYLADQPLDTIRAYIRGEWNWVLSGGGFTGRVRHYPQNSTIKFGSDDQIRLIYESELIYDTIIYWRYDDNILNDSTYIMRIFRKDGVPHFPFTSWWVSGIRNDTLSLIDNANDGYGHALTKRK